jgi:hypothetical protein
VHVGDDEEIEEAADDGEADRFEWDERFECEGKEEDEVAEISEDCDGEV